MNNEQLDKKIKELLNAENKTGSNGFISSQDWGEYLNDRISKSKPRWKLMSYILNVAYPLNNEQLFKEEQQCDNSWIMKNMTDEKKRILTWKKVNHIFIMYVVN